MSMGLVGITGRLERPFWGLLGAWAALCGTLASNSLHWRSDDLLALAVVVLQAELAWGSLWDLAAGPDWLRLLRQGWPPADPPRLMALPYSQPGSPGGRIYGWLAKRVAWWRVAFWPVAGSTLLGWLGAAFLTVVLALLLPRRLYPLYAALAVLLLVGILGRRWRGLSLAGRVLVQVGLSWLAGCLAFSALTIHTVIAAVLFSAVVWGALQFDQWRKGSLWLVNAGQGLAMAHLVWLKEPLAAGAVGLLLLAQVAVQLSLWRGTEAARVARRIGPWLMAAMLVVALAMP